MRSQLLTVAILVGYALAAPAYAESPAYPSLLVDDSWKYTLTLERDGVKSGLGSANVTVESAAKDGAFAISNRDLTIANDKQIADISHVIARDTCIVDLISQLVILGGAPCAVTLSEGQQWRQESRNGAIEITKEFKFVGMQDVKVPAGIFSALFIECENFVKKPGGTTRMSRKYWYAPEVRGIVAMTNQTFDANGKPGDKFSASLMAFSGK
jgi:hypothetical protein